MQVAPSEFQIWRQGLRAEVFAQSGGEISLGDQRRSFSLIWSLSVLRSAILENVSHSKIFSEPRIS